MGTLLMGLTFSLTSFACVGPFVGPLLAASAQSGGARPLMGGALPYGATVLEHFKRPRNQRALEHPSVAREAYNPLCGDRVRIELEIERLVIQAAAFTANACAICTASASLLASCVTKRESPPANEMAESAAGPLERELRIFNWSDYIAADTISRFEKEFDVRVTYDTYESNEEMAAKLVAGGDGYDIVSPSGYLVPVLIEGGLLQPLDHAVLGNWRNLLPLRRPVNECVAFSYW